MDRPRVALFGLFSVGFTITILSVSIPRIAEEMGSDTSTVTWVVTGPLLAFAVAGPAMGKLGDLYGHRRVYALSMACVCVFAGLTAAAWSAGSLIAFRTLGAATGAAVGSGVDRHHQPDVPARAAGAGDGLLVDGRRRRPGDRRGRRRADRRDVRLALDLHRAGAAHLHRAAARAPRAARDRAAPRHALRLRRRRRSSPSAPRRSCSPSTAGRASGWSSPAIVAGFVVAPVAFVVFVLVERRVAHPLLPLAYLRRRNFSFAIATQFFTNFAYMGGFVITPLFLESVFGYPETRVGGADDRPAARVRHHRSAGRVRRDPGGGAHVGGGRRPVRGGLDGGAVDGRARVRPTWSSSARSPLSGVGLGCSSPALTASMANAVEERDLGVAGAFQQMMTQLGVVLGIQLMQTVTVVRQDAVGEVEAYGEAYLLAAVVAAVGVVCALFVQSTRRAEGAPEGALEPSTGLDRRRRCAAA